jgi:nucleotide-binding universal stress UspA family protein
MYTRILVPVDGSEPAECGLREAIGIAASTKAKLVVLNVVSEFPILMDGVSLAYYEDLLAALTRAGEDLVAKAAAKVTEAGVDCETVVVDARTSRAADVIVEQVARCGCDLVVMGTHGRRGFKRMAMGSDAELVVRHSPVPVLLVKPPAAPR